MKVGEGKTLIAPLAPRDKPQDLHVATFRYMYLSEWPTNAVKMAKSDDSLLLIKTTNVEFLIACIRHRGGVKPGNKTN